MFFEPPVERLKGNVRTPPIARWKARGRLSKSAFSKGWVTLSANFRRKGASPTNYCWCQETRVIAFSCGINMSAVCCLVLSKSTRVSDRRTDIETRGRTDTITTPKTALAKLSRAVIILSE